MDLMNVKAILAATIVNFVIGFLWYNPKTLGNIWMKEAGLSPEDPGQMNMVKLMAISLIMSFLFSTALMPVVIHQMGAASSMQNHLMSADATIKAAAESDFSTFLSKYGNEFRTFKHGAFHGFLTALFLILPVIATNGSYEKKSWKYILINAGYWAVCAMLSGGIICAWQN